VIASMPSRVIMALEGATHIMQLGKQAFHYKPPFSSAKINKKVAAFFNFSISFAKIDTAYVQK